MSGKSGFWRNPVAQMKTSATSVWPLAVAMCQQPLVNVAATISSLKRMNLARPRSRVTF